MHGGLAIPFPLPSFIEDGLNQVQKDVSAASRSIGDNLNFAYNVGQNEMGKYSKGHRDEDGIHDQVQDDKKIWGLTLNKRGVSSENSLDIVDVKGRFVFVGAGGMSLIMLEKAGIPEVAGYGGFPVSGEFLVCKNPAVVERHINKVYGLAAVGSPPMSVPHLDRRLIDGQPFLLFGPFAGFSPKFLKGNSLMDGDLLKSFNPFNAIPVAAAGLQNMDLSVYLGKELVKTHHQKMDEVRKFFPEAKDEDWTNHTAGQRVQIMKYDPVKMGAIQFGTEVVVHKDKTICGLLGASPGASVSVRCALEVVERCFPREMKEGKGKEGDLAHEPAGKWNKIVREWIPAYQTKVNADPELAKKVLSHTAKVLDIRDMRNEYKLPEK